MGILVRTKEGHPVGSHALAEVSNHIHVFLGIAFVTMALPAGRRSANPDCRCRRREGRRHGAPSHAASAKRLSDELDPFVEESVEPGSVVHTDGWLGYEPQSQRLLFGYRPSSRFEACNPAQCPCWEAMYTPACCSADSDSCFTSSTIPTIV